MTARDDFLTMLDDSIATDDRLQGVRIITSGRTVDGDLANPIIQCRTDRWERLAEAPKYGMTWHGILTLVSSHRDMDRAEDQLETLIDALTDHLYGNRVLWGEANLVGWPASPAPTYLAYDITVQYIAQKER